MKVVLDNNVLLDLFLDRQPWSVEAASIWDAHHRGAIDACFAGFAVPTLFYVARRHAGKDAADAAIKLVLSTLTIVPLFVGDLVAAGSMPGSDFEDNLHIISAVRRGCIRLFCRDRRIGAEEPEPHT